MSQEFKGTPGPWKVFSYLNGYGIQFQVALDRQILVDVYQEGPGERYDKVAEANTHLIAAAPDLFAASLAAQQCIADLIEAIKRGATDLVINEALGSCKTDALPLLKKAIAKALNS